MSTTQERAVAGIEPAGAAQERQRAPPRRRRCTSRSTPACRRTARRTRRGSPRRARRSSRRRGSARRAERARAGSTARARRSCARAPPDRGEPVASTPSPSRVMIMSRRELGRLVAVRPGGSTTSSRHEFVPWSITATRPPIACSGWIGSTSFGDPRADGVVTAGQVVRVVGVQALQPAARAADAAPRARPRAGSAARSSPRRPVRRARRSARNAAIGVVPLVQPGDRTRRPPAATRP